MPSVTVATPAVPVAVATSLACAAVVTVLGLVGSALAVPFGVLASGTVAVAGGSLVVRRGLVRGGLVAFRVLLGSGAVVFGVGQVLLAGAVARGGATFPTAGDVVSTLSVPLVVAGLMLLPGRSGETGRGRRLASEAVMLGCAGAALAWRLALRDVLGAGDAVAVLILLADLSILALVLIAAVRELDRGLLLALAGTALYVVGDLVTMHAVAQPGGAWPWAAATLAAAAWPLISVGLLRISATPPALPDAQVPGAEQRRTVVAAVGLCALLLVLFGTFLLDPVLDAVTVALIAVMVLAYADGEVVRARQNRSLLAQVRAQALTDPLTGLGNRRALAERLVRPPGGPRSVLTLDLDGFKQVNSLLGHTGGDALLVGVAAALRRLCNEQGARAYRLGGDEFALVAGTDLAGGRRLGQACVDAVLGLRDDVPSAAGVDMSTCVGVAQAPGRRGAAGDPMTTLTQSASALRVAKQGGRGTVVAFTAALALAEHRRGRVEARLRRALRTDGLAMHFQPVVDLRTGALLGLEALARWDDEELGSVPPDEFVPVAEQTGLVVELGAFALRRGVEVLARSGAADAGVNVGVNASVVELRSPGYVDQVAQVLHRYGVAPQRLVLEVTESLFVDDDDPAIRTLQGLSGLGVAIAIDDFGTGYSSLAYVHRLPVDVLKVDRSITAALDAPRIRAVLRAVVELGLALGLDVVVEGVETAAMASDAREAGVRIGQGWHFSRAVPAAAVPALLGRRWDVGAPAAARVRGS